MTGIIVGVDGSEGSAHALRWAVREGEVRGWPVTALMSWGWLDPPHDGADGPLPLWNEAKARAALAAAVADAVRDPAGIRQDVVCDLATRALVDAAAGASLLVVGARGLGPLKRVLLGSVSAHCLHHAPCPIAIIRPGADPADGFGGTVVVGVDGSEGSDAALAWAIEEAVARHAQLEALSAWQYPVMGETAWAGVDPGVFEEAAELTLDRDLAAADTAGLEQPVRRVTVPAGAGRALVERSQQAGLVVVGSRGRGGFAGLLLGSVGHQLAHHAACPVVIVRDGAAREHRP